MSSKIAVDCDCKLKKSSKFGWVSLFLSFHLPADVKLAGHFFGVTFEWLILKPKNWEWLRSKAQKKLKIKAWFLFFFELEVVLLISRR